MSMYCSCSLDIVILKVIQVPSTSVYLADKMSPRFLHSEKLHQLNNTIVKEDLYALQSTQLLVHDLDLRLYKTSQ